MQTIYTGLDQTWDCPIDRAAGVQNDLFVVTVSLVGEGLEPGHHKLIEQAGTDDQVALGAKIVAKEEGFEGIPSLLKEKLVGIVIKLSDPVGDGLYDFGMGVHLDQVVFHSKEFHNIVIERRPETTGPVSIFE